MSLLNLSQEILQMILEELLPSMNDSGLQSDICPFDVLRFLPVPYDLCSLMAVCTFFHDLAEPFVWRRVTISLRVPKEPEDDAVVGSRYFQGQLFFQWPSLFRKKRLASHIRILTLEIRGYKRDTASSLRTLNSVVSSMSNLRVLRLNIDSEHRTIEQIYTSLVSKPLLHTVIILHRTSPKVQIPPRNTLTHLNILLWRSEYEFLFLAAPCLQSLAIAAPDKAPHEVTSLDTLPIPWGTLRKVAFKWVENWDLVLINLSSWKNSHPDVLSPLSEFTIQLTGPHITTENLHRVSRMGQDLRALYLCGPNVVDEWLFDTILHAFPNLEDLGLLTEYWCKPWDVTLPTLVAFLERLPRLKRLHWNYVDKIAVQGTTFDEEVRALKVMFRQTVPIVAVRCEALERIIFNDESESRINGEPRDGMFHSYSILRDQNGGYSDYEEETLVLMSWSLDRTSWDFWDYDYV